jgi:hypothetical protein
MPYKSSSSFFTKRKEEQNKFATMIPQSAAART